MNQKLAGILCLLTASSFLGGCGYNAIQGLDEDVKASWAEVQNQYQRRSDLVPNLVNVVKGYAKHESETLEAVVKARAEATQSKIDVSGLTDSQAFARFQKAQGELSSALSRLMVVVEKYPDLKANENFRDLQSQLEGTENRITVARNRYIDAVNEYNKKVRYFPTNLTAQYLLHMKVREVFQADAAAQQAPKVQF
ncbi:MAG TPA: LemA family protein [Bdellovibrionota bacterium]|jgi:LemA protein|nr:LemA family protein [Bdellovibrionota bacterium]